jgi:cytochrome P450
MHDFSCEEPRFDVALDAWVLSRFADVSVALRDPRFSPSPMGNAPSSPSTRETVGGVNPETRRIPRIGTQALDDGLGASASARLRALPTEGPVDLVRDFAAPWSLEVAASCCGVAPRRATELATIAHEAFAAAAHASDAMPTPHGLSAVSTLARALAADRAIAPLDVQTFVALTHTLPSTLGNVWLTLLEHPGQMRELRDDPALMPRAVEELLRFAGPSRAVFRYAHEQILIGGTAIDAGARVVLLLSDANRDPMRFADAHRLDVRRDAAAHLAFGRGTHGCVGAGLIRSALRAATEALLDAATSIELAGEVEWIDGFAIRGVTRLPVVLDNRQPA